MFIVGIKVSEAPSSQLKENAAVDIRRVCGKHHCKQWAVFKWDQRSLRYKKRECHHVSLADTSLQHARL